jgi:hypothetical protein
MRVLRPFPAVLFVAFLGFVTAPPTRAQAGAPLPSQALPGCDGPFWPVFWIVTIFLFLFLIITFVALLRSKDWSLADTVSEEASPQPAVLPADREGKPIMVASTSRLVALLGLLGILSMFLGVGYYILWSLFCKNTVPQLWEIMRFFYGGAAMFAPYAVNQIRTAFEAFSPGGKG